MNQVRLKTPFPLVLAWDKGVTVNYITVHAKVAGPMHQALQEILDVYGYKRIKELKLDQWGGTLSVRKKRGRTRGYSVHSWGAATDWYPTGNQLRTPWKKAAFSHADYIPFFNAWIRVGAKPLGLTWGRDAMHIEFTQNDLEFIQPYDKRFRGSKPSVSQT